MLLVHKYGGSSVANPERIAAVADRVAGVRGRGDQVVVVVSAMGEATDELLEQAHETVSSPPTRELDALLATGELASSALVAMALSRRGVPSVSVNAYQAGISTDARFGNARITGVDGDKLLAMLARDLVPVVAGFQGVTEGGDIATLGRGGTDTTAVALAAVLGADECRIYTDVDGVYAADPRLAPKVRRLERVTFEEMLEMSSLGAKVLQVRSVQLAGIERVPLRVLSSFEPEGHPGTLIDYGAENGGTGQDGQDGRDAVEQPKVSAIAHTRDEAKMTLRGVPDQPGVAARILGPVSEAEVNVDVIVQTPGRDGKTDFTFTVPRQEMERAEEILRRIRDDIQAEAVEADPDIAKVSIVGVGMRSHAGVAAKAFRALSEAQVNIQLISTSEIKITIVVNDASTELAVRTLVEAFGLHQQD